MILLNGKGVATIAEARPLARALYLGAARIIEKRVSLCYYFKNPCGRVTVVSAGGGKISFHLYQNTPDMKVEDVHTNFTRFGLPEVTFSYNGAVDLLMELYHAVKHLMRTLEPRGKAHPFLLKVLRRDFLNRTNLCSMGDMMARAQLGLKTLRYREEAFPSQVEHLLFRQDEFTFKEFPLTATDISTTLTDRHFILGARGILELHLLRVKLRFGHFTGPELYDINVCPMCADDLDVCECVH